MTGIRTLNLLLVPLEKWNPKGLFFVGTFEKKIQRVQILSASLKKKSEPSLAKTRHPWGGGGGGGVRIKNGMSPVNH